MNVLQQWGCNLDKYVKDRFILIYLKHRWEFLSVPFKSQKDQLNNVFTR